MSLLMLLGSADLGARLAEGSPQECREYSELHRACQDSGATSHISASVFCSLAIGGIDDLFPPLQKRSNLPE
jgi:hypothetical protein